MSKQLATRRELLDRWRGIEEEEEDDDGDHDSSKRRRLHHLKEQWFADAFNFLICFPKDTHIWCGSWDLMGPLLETFYNYFKDEHPDSPLKQLWKRISDEMRKCIQCISQYHQALEMYDREYELSCIIPLLDVLRTLDEQRVTQHLREINARIAREEYDPARDNAEVVSVMYEKEIRELLGRHRETFVGGGLDRRRRNLLSVKPRTSTGKERGGGSRCSFTGIARGSRGCLIGVFCAAWEVPRP